MRKLNKIFGDLGLTAAFGFMGCLMFAGPCTGAVILGAAAFSSMIVYLFTLPSNPCHKDKENKP